MSDNTSKGCLTLPVISSLLEEIHLVDLSESLYTTLHSQDHNSLAKNLHLTSAVKNRNPVGISICFFD
jgi:hypothetical protein